MSFDKIGPAIVMWRESRGLSQKQMAAACGIGRAQVSRYENGKELPKLPTLERILAGLDVAPDHFFRSLVQLAEYDDTPVRPTRPIRLQARKIAAVFGKLEARDGRPACRDRRAASGDRRLGRAASGFRDMIEDQRGHRKRNLSVKAVTVFGYALEEARRPSLGWWSACTTVLSKKGSRHGP